MKRILTLILALCLAFALSAPALAETAEKDMEKALQDITIHVKTILDIDDDYQSFSGNYNDGLRPGWNLYWSDDGRDLSVTCDEAGTITEVYFWKNTGGRSYFYGFNAAFPAMKQEDAEAQAAWWLERLMGEGESARIDTVRANLTSDGNYYFTGRILMNGLESPVSFSLAIGADGLQNYNRSDSYNGYVGGVPSDKPEAKETDAVKALADAVAMDLYYVTDAEGEARLRYVPVGPYTVVDAQTGEAVDMDALYASFGSSALNGAEAPMAEAAMAMDSGFGNSRALTVVELTSIANYADAKSQEELDEGIRAIAHIGLEGFELQRCSYSMDEDGNITANLRYTCEMTEDNLFGFSLWSFRDTAQWNSQMTVTKYLSANAKTGELISLSTSYPVWERAAGGSSDIAYDTAEAFLTACAPEKFAETAMREGSAADGRDSQTYARMHDGYFFPENYLQVSVNSATGAVDDYYFVWDDDAKFAPSEGIVSIEDAKAAYIGALDVTLGYVAWPEAINYDDPILYRYIDWGYTFVESLRLAYYYSGTADIAGVDALTGEPVTTSSDGSFSYDDLTGIPQREVIELLGENGIGFDGGFFRPAAALTQRDAVILLLQAAGNNVKGWEEDLLRSQAVWYGFIAADDWEPERVVTADAFLHMIIGASPYGPAAELPGVGYETIASALDLTGGTDGLTRADGAEMLYTFMKR